MIKKLAKKLGRKSSSSAASKTSSSTRKTTSRKSAAGRTSKKRISQEDFAALVAEKAYELFQNRGYSHGDDLADWYEAEKIVLKKVKK